MEISPITPLRIGQIENPTGGINKPAAPDNDKKLNFNDVLSSLTESENHANDMLAKLASGEDVELHDVMIATEENDVNFRVAMAIRDRLVDAYREVMRMNI